MIKMLVVMDEEKILREDHWSLESMNETIKKIYADNGLKLGTDGYFVGNNDEHDLANFFIVANYLEDQEWFMENVKIWEYDHDGNREDWISGEEIS